MGVGVSGELLTKSDPGKSDPGGRPFLSKRLKGLGHCKVALSLSIK